MSAAKRRSKKARPRPAASPRNIVFGLVALLLAVAAARELWPKATTAPPPAPEATGLPASSAASASAFALAPRPPASTSITNVAVAKDPARPGEEQRLTIRTKPNAYCNVGLSSADGSIDDAPGLGPKQANFQGDVEWTWTSEFPPFEAKEPVLMKLEIVCDGATTFHLYRLLP